MISSFLHRKKAPGFKIGTQSLDTILDTDEGKFWSGRPEERIFDEFSLSQILYNLFDTGLVLLPEEESTGAPIGHGFII